MYTYMLQIKNKWVYDRITNWAWNKEKAINMKLSLCASCWASKVKTKSNLTIGWAWQYLYIDHGMCSCVFLSTLRIFNQFGKYRVIIEEWIYQTRCQNWFTTLFVNASLFIIHFYPILFNTLQFCRPINSIPIVWRLAM